MMQVNHKIHVNMLACLNIELQKSFFEAFMVTKICHYEDVKKFLFQIYTSQLKCMCTTTLLVLNKDFCIFCSRL